MANLQQQVEAFTTTDLQRKRQTFGQFMFALETVLRDRVLLGIYLEEEARAALVAAYHRLQALYARVPGIPLDDDDQTTVPPHLFVPDDAVTKALTAALTSLFRTLSEAMLKQREALVNVYTDRFAALGLTGPGVKTALETTIDTAVFRAQARDNVVAVAAGQFFSSLAAPRPKHGRSVVLTKEEQIAADQELAKRLHDTLNPAAVEAAGYATEHHLMPALEAEAAPGTDMVAVQETASQFTTGVVDIAYMSLLRDVLQFVGSSLGVSPEALATTERPQPLPLLSPRYATGGARAAYTPAQIERAAQVFATLSREAFGGGFAGPAQTGPLASSQQQVRRPQLAPSPYQTAYGRP